MLCLALTGLAWVPDAWPQEHWSSGLDAGLWSGTLNGTVFAVAGNVDYHPVKVFSVGGMVLLAPGSDLTQVAVAGVARYYYETRWGTIVPFAGLGFIHTNASIFPQHESSTSHYVPLGVTLQYQVARKVALATTALLNLHALNLTHAGVGDEASVALLFGVRFGP